MKLLPLTLEDWVEENETELTILYDRTGASREMDFDPETLDEIEYNKYLKNFNDIDEVDFN